MCNGIVAEENLSPSSEVKKRVIIGAVPTKAGREYIMARMMYLYFLQ
jgi:hypothetical protein